MLLGLSIHASASSDHRCVFLQQKTLSLFAPCIPLSWFVPWVFTDNIDSSFSPYNFTINTSFLDWWLNFHCFLFLINMVRSCYGELGCIPDVAFIPYRFLFNNFVIRKPSKIRWIIASLSSFTNLNYTLDLLQKERNVRIEGWDTNR